MLPLHYSDLVPFSVTVWTAFTLEMCLRVAIGLIPLGTLAFLVTRKCRMHGL